MNELTIVTAFFDVGRKDFKGLSRSNELYLSYFKFWARIKNKLIVYTDNIMAKEVKKIRKEFGLLDKTEIIVIDDISKIEPNLYNKMQKISIDKTFLDFRYMENPADNNAKYDYIMLLKFWFIKDAVEKGYASGLITWLDFGFNHGGKFYPCEDEFDFSWETDLPKDKVTVFSIKDDINKPIFQIIQSYEVYMMGAPFFVPDNLAIKFWDAAKKSMESLIDCGFIDDDQTIMLMVSRNCEFINVVKSEGWMLPLKESGAKHLTFKYSKNNPSFKDRLLYKYRVYKRNKACINRLKKMFKKDYLD